MDKYIFRKRKFLNKSYCKRVIDWFDNDLSVDDKIFDDRRGYVKRYINLRNDLMFNEVGHLLHVALLEYKSQHPFLKKIPWKIQTNCNFQKYLKGKSYGNEHSERGYDWGVGHCDWDRVLVWMFYLNTIHHKGGTCWPQQKFTSKPRAGDLYIWPADWTHSHYGVAAPVEEKYIITGWCVYQSDKVLT